MPEQVRELYEAYFAEFQELEQGRRLGAGAFGLGGGPRDYPCHGQFAKKLERLLKELLPGETVYRLALRNAVEPWHRERVRALSQSLRAAGWNIDWFPTNFIPGGGTLYYVDYECNPYMERWSFETWGVRYWSRTPEFDAYAKEHGDL